MYYHSHIQPSYQSWCNVTDVSVHPTEILKTLISGQVSIESKTKMILGWATRCFIYFRAIFCIRVHRSGSECLIFHENQATKIYRIINIFRPSQIHFSNHRLKTTSKLDFNIWKVMKFNDDSSYFSSRDVTATRISFMKHVKEMWYGHSLWYKVVIFQKVEGSTFDSIYGRTRCWTTIVFKHR